MFSVFYFIGIYFTLVEAYSASRSGIQLLFYLPGIGRKPTPPNISYFFFKDIFLKAVLAHNNTLF